MPYAPPQPWRVRMRPFLLPALAVIPLLLMLHLGYRSGHDRAERAAEAEQFARLEIGSRTVAQLLIRSLEGFEVYFELLNDLTRMRAEGGSMQPAIERRLSSLTRAERGGVFQATIIDADGIARWSSLDGNANVDLSDRDHFIAHLRPGVGLYVSAPLLGRVSNRWSVQFTRRLERADGGFAGVAVLSVDPLLLSAQLATLEGLPGQTHSLFRADGRLLASNIANQQELLERNIRGVLQPGADGTLTTRQVSNLTGDDRLFALRSLPGVPLYVGLSVPYDTAMAEFHQLRRILWLTEIGLALLIITGLAAGALLLARSQQERDLDLLEASRAELARVLDGLRAAVFLQRIGPDGAQPPSYINAGTMRVLRLGPGQFDPHERLLRRADPPISDETRERHFRQLREDGNYLDEVRLRCGDGTLRWMRLASTCIGKDSRGMEVVSLLIDIEEEKAAQAVVAEAAELRRAEMARVLDGISGYACLYRFHPDGSVTRDYASVGGSLYQEDEMSGPPDGPSGGMDVAAAYAALARDGHYTRERQLRRADGSLAWVRLSFNLIGRQGDDLEVVGLITDIDDEKAASAAAVAAARLATVGELAAGLAHEMNQPLAVILLSAENVQRRLERGTPDAIPYALERLERIARMTLRAREITDHLRMFTHGEDGPPGETRLEDAVRGALVLCGQALRDAEVTLESEIPPDLPAVVGKQVLLEHVLLNLLINARDAMLTQPATGRRIRIVATPTARDVLLTVTDSGPGIAPEVLPRIFQPFFSTKPAGQGTGLGLCITQGILAPWGGSITAANAHPGAELGGAVFTVGLPRAG